jgi:thermitase
MRRHILTIIRLSLLVLFAYPIVSVAQEANMAALPPAFAPDRVLVAFQPGTPGIAMSDAHRQANGQVVKTLEAIGVQIIAVPAGTVLDTVAVYQHNPNVRFAEPDYFRTFVVPDEGSDPVLGIQDYFNEQWGLHNIGQPLTDPGTGSPTLSGTSDADIDAPEGWNISTGSSDIVIAILDSGIDCNSVELNGKCLGAAMNFVSEYEGLADILGHGTHVAGIAAANTDNGIGIAGVGWNSSIVSLKVCYGWPAFLPLLGVCPVSASIEAITHAADMGYDVINMSYGSDEVDSNGAPIALAGHSEAEAAAVSYAWNNNVVIVAAAGNNANTTLSYPAAYPEVIAVAATNSDDNLASFSSFGNNWVSVAAPGENILSTFPDAACAAALPGYDPGDSCLTWQSGTSMASPHVAGAVALVRAVVASNEEARDLIESGADQIGAGGQNFLAWTQHGRLNIYQALAASQGPNTPPTASFNHFCTGLACSFDGTASSDPGGSIVSYAWDFGDSSTGSGSSVTHTYASAGIYTASLTVTDNNGATNSTSQSIITSEPVNAPPTANFSFACSGRDCSFDASASSDPDGAADIVNYVWSILDGDTTETRSGKTITYSYVNTGSSFVSLTVTDSAGNFDTASTTLRVKNRGRSDGDTSGGGDTGGGTPGGSGSFCDKNPDHKKCSQ